MLQFGVDDTEDQTRRVLESHAASVNGHDPRPNSLTRGASDLARPRWRPRRHRPLRSSVLAKLVPAGLVRMRRDFRQLLTAIQTIALLYQRQRQRDEHGRVIATIEDYGQARELLVDAFTQAATGVYLSPYARQWPR